MICEVDEKNAELKEQKLKFQWFFFLFLQHLIKD